ncbi:MAG TPA: PilZ domain-containing protein [Gemmataceae bacterium]|nr:PilZ domain-containing protein [Gemmataceae bacterium]
MSRLGGSSVPVLAPIRNADRRNWIRYPCSKDITCRVLTDDNEAFWAIRPQNISEGGIKLILDRFIGIGEMAAVEVFNNLRGFSFQGHIQVLFTFEDLHGYVVLGGSFIPEISAKDLEELLGFRY